MLSGTFLSILMYNGINVLREIGWLLCFVNFFVEWLESPVSLPPVDVIFAQLACPLNDIITLFTSGIANLSLNKH